MFDIKELNKIDDRYFTVLQTTGYHVTLQSKNTKHIWDIYCKEIGCHRSLVISHKHNENDPFHEQPKMHPKDLVEAQNMIKKHDRWHLDGRKK